MLAAAFGLPVFACASDEGPGGESIETVELPWMVSSTACTMDNQCNSSDAGSPYSPCQVHYGDCDEHLSVRKCKLRLAHFDFSSTAG